MGKTGSTSIQRWLAQRSTELRTEQDLRLIVAKRTRDSAGSPGLNVVPYERGSVKSEFVPGFYGYDADAPADTQFFDGVELYASNHRTVLLTGEGFSALFWGANDANLSALDQLRDAHNVRVAYYVRPQHTYLEAAWRQWGFRSTDKPSRFIRFRRRMIRYLQTLERVQRLAPRISMEIRPFRRDLLEGRDVVTDFARVFLGMEDLVTAKSSERRSNVGLPLDLLILLRDAPPGMFWSSDRDNRRLDQLRNLLSTWDVPESRRVRRSRLVLQHYCHEQFESDNQRLIEKLGWHATNFVPPVSRDDAPDLGDIEELNQLWRTNASDGERHLLFLALDRLLRVAAPAPNQ
jgi:hypothetical protein